MRKNKTKVAIIILNCNGWKDTIECLESVFRIDYPNYQVIVVNNGSTDDLVENIKVCTKGKIKVISNFFEFKYDLNKKPIEIIGLKREDEILL